MSTFNIGEIILKDWIASLKERDRKAASIKGNFEDLFQNWKDAGLSFEDTYGRLLDKAIKAHLPSPSVTRNSYKYYKSSIKGFDKTEKEFVEEWFSSIENVAISSYHEFYPLPVKKVEAKNFGNMSVSEYRAQRRYAEQFPVLDTSDLEKRWQERQYNLDIEDMLKNVLGDEDEIDI